MGAVTVRNLDESTRDRLKALARSHGRSMESEARAILTAAVTPAAGSSAALGTRISVLFADLEGDEIDSTRTDETARAAVLEA